jgi:hypothetical protein
MEKGHGNWYLECEEALEGRRNKSLVGKLKKCKLERSVNHQLQTGFSYIIESFQQLKG